MPPAFAPQHAQATTSQARPFTPFTPASAPDPPPIHRVAITGGPCAGKTTALAEISERLRSRGFAVYVVPEAATLMLTGGATFAGLAPAQVLCLQTALLRTQLALEDSFAAVARASGRESFVLADRGTCDGRAYMDGALWKRMLREQRWELVELRDARYDLVVHLVTAAEGAAQYYSLESNKTRSETAEEARAVDRRTREAWVGHPHLGIVDNRTGFREKINRVDARISELAGVHLAKRVVRKFLVRGVRDARKVAGEDFAVEQTFLERRDGEGEGQEQECVRKRGREGVFTFVHKIRKGTFETKRQITSTEYRSLLRYGDPERGTVRIRRQCFLEGENYFVLDSVQNVQPTVQLLRCHCDAEEAEDSLKVPEWVEVDREVTGEKEFSMYMLSKRVSATAAVTIKANESGHGEGRSRTCDFAKSF